MPYLTRHVQMAGYPFRDRPPNAIEFARFRLALSTFTDGSGQSTFRGTTQPGWRDAERAAAAAFGGVAQENKAVFDVEIPTRDHRLPYGMSMKMSRLNDDENRVLMELSNSSSKFWKRLQERGIDPEKEPAAAGAAIIQLVREWHEAARDRVDVDRSAYVVVTHDSRYRYWRLFWFSLPFKDPTRLRWVRSGRAIQGYDGQPRLWEWYGQSGGQLKYYPLVSDAIWDSGRFELEAPPGPDTFEAKVERYWPGRWG